MKENWTKGEWFASKPVFGRIDIYSNHSVGGRECKQGRQSVAITHYTSKKENPEYAEMFLANAHLIAAAPKLYEALKAMTEDFKRLADSGDAGFLNAEDQPEYQQAMQSLAAARGEDSRKTD